MCLGIPGEVLEVREANGLKFAAVRFAGVTREVCLELLPDAAVGEFVLVHVGFAISRLNAEEAQRTWRALAELGLLDEIGPDEKLEEAS